MAQLGRITGIFALAAVLSISYGCNTPTDGNGNSNTSANDNQNDNNNLNDNSANASRAARRDFWTTEATSESQQDFSSSPVPAGFFDFDGKSCEPFTGMTNFAGSPVGESTLGSADTIVDREDDPIQQTDAVGTVGTVDVEIVSLNLSSMNSITVMCDGEPTQWNIRATLSDAPAPRSTLTATKEHDNGGTAKTVLNVLLRLVFTNVDDPTIERIMDNGENGLDPIVFEANIPWVHAIDTTNPDPTTSFVLGVAGGPNAANLNKSAVAAQAAGDTLITCTEHFNPGGSHLHNTCTTDTDSDGVPDGVDNCRFLVNSDQADMDGDTFGDACDACPDDPNCPQTGGECDDECVTLNTQMCAIIEPLFDWFCMCANCFPPDCDITTYVVPASCQDPEAILNAQLQGDFESITEQFMALGCDRCNLEPCAAPPCEFQTVDVCDFITCPEGQMCDSTTGTCCDLVDGQCADTCVQTGCTDGQFCNPISGVCESLPDLDVSFCSITGCPDGQTCNETTQMCE